MDAVGGTYIVQVEQFELHFVLAVVVVHRALHFLDPQLLLHYLLF